MYQYIPYEIIKASFHLYKNGKKLNIALFKINMNFYHFSVTVIKSSEVRCIENSNIPKLYIYIFIAYAICGLVCLIFLPYNRWRKPTAFGFKTWKNWIKFLFRYYCFSKELNVHTVGNTPIYTLF